MQQLHGPDRDFNRHPATMRVSESYVETTLDDRDIKGQTAFMGDSEIHAAIPLNLNR